VPVKPRWAFSGVLALALAASGTSFAEAQQPAGALIAEARRRIDDLYADSAAALLRVALQPPAGATRRDSVRAFVLLGVAELMAARQDAARQAFRNALALEPGLRVDTLADLHSHLLLVFGSALSSVTAVSFRLVFTIQPSSVAAGAAVSPAVQVTVQDARGYTVTAATDRITLAITSGTGALGATLGGTLTAAAANGVATFRDLTVDKPEAGYALTASSTGAVSGASRSFQVLLAAVALEAGYGHACALASGGAAYCWGSNDSGQLGDGTSVHRGSPVAVVGGLTFTSLSAAFSHTCGLTDSGAAYCWGANSSGQLGDGTIVGHSSPAAVVGGLTFTSLSAGILHTCGLTNSGVAYCWGGNSAGQLGDRATISRSRPVAVEGGLTFKRLSAGSFHTCGLTSGGAAYCWGGNAFGQLGDGTIVSHGSPFAVAVGMTFTGLTAGALHTCGLTSGGAAYCWGSNEQAQLGDGTIANRSRPVAVAGGLTFTRLSAGFSSTCGLANRGAAYCWGGASAEGFGQLGRRLSTPVAVLGGLTFTTLSLSGRLACALAGGGAAYCWGGNVGNAAGEGTAVDRTPLRVSGF
jgi:alpha-tubulin suppressor-like RCC1 family protein